MNHTIVSVVAVAIILFLAAFSGTATTVSYLTDTGQTEVHFSTNESFATNEPGDQITVPEENNQSKSGTGHKDSEEEGDQEDGQKDDGEEGADRKEDDGDSDDGDSDDGDSDDGDSDDTEGSEATDKKE